MIFFDRDIAQFYEKLFLYAFVRGFRPHRALEMLDAERLRSRLRRDGKEFGAVERQATDAVTGAVGVVSLVKGPDQLDTLTRGWKQAVGVEVPNDGHGVLQDVHWSGGGIGYFPTYTIGNLYSVLLWNAVKADIPDIHARIEAGEGRIEDIELLERTLATAAVVATAYATARSACVWSTTTRKRR